MLGVRVMFRLKLEFMILCRMRDRIGIALRSVFVFKLGFVLGLGRGLEIS